jgi:pimeloyl-ACP methyl ester carboxylesterase
VKGEAKYRTVEERLWQSVGLQPTEQFVRLPRLGTAVRIQEIGEGAPTLFIHGGPNSGTTWVPLAAGMTGFRCLLLDRPGTGLSEQYSARKENLIDFASYLVSDVLDGLQIDSAHVVASSFGGYCALRSAATTPERFERMVQMACPALLPEQPIPQFMKTIMIPGMRRIIAALPPNKKVQESILRQIGHGKSLDAGKLPPAHDAWYTALTRHTNTMRNEFDMIYSVRAKGGFDHAVALGAETLRGVPVPTHFLWGADDTFGDESVARWVVESMPAASLEMIPDSGHLPWLDDPAYIAQRAAQFLVGQLADGEVRAEGSETS